MPRLRTQASMSKRRTDCEWQIAICHQYTTSKKRNLLISLILLVSSALNMNVHRPNRNWQHPGLVVIVVVVAVLTKLFLATTIVVMAFQSPLVSVSTNSYAGHHQSIFPLYTSLSVPPDYRPSDFDEDTNTNTNNGGQHHEITIEKFERHPHHQDTP